MIALTFIRIDLESSQGCLKDSIKIFNGNISSSDNEIATLCNPSVDTSMVFYSESNTMLVTFTTDDEETRSGFEATYISTSEPLFPLLPDPLPRK